MNQIFRLKDIMYGIRKHLTVIVGMTLAGLLVGIVIFVVQSFSASNTVSYQVFSSFSVSTANNVGLYVGGNSSPGSGDFDLAAKMVDPISYICHSEKVCGEVLERLNLVGVRIKTLQNALSLRQYGDTPIVEITLRWKDADEGVLIMNTVMEILPGAIQEILNIGEIKLIESSLVVPITMEVGIKNVLLLTGMGFMLGMLYCFSQLYMHPTLIEIKDVNELFGINLLSGISEEQYFSVFMAQNLITNRQDLPVTMRESYMALAHILLHQIDEDHFSLFVTSASRGEGKTTVVSNLGMELAALDKRVLLIDFDLTSPALGGFFLDDIDYMHTVNAVYFDDTSVQEAIIRINEYLYLLPARLDKRHMGVDRFAKKLVAQMENEFDVVLIDTAPVGESSETLYFSNVSNSAMFVIRYDYTPCDVIEESIEKLQKTSTVIHGAVVNRIPHLGFTSSSVWEGGSKQKKEKDTRKENPAVSAGKKKGFAKRKPKKDASKQEKKHDDDLMEDEIVTKASAPKKPVAQKRRNQPMPQDDDDDDLMEDERVISASASKKPAAQKQPKLSMPQDDDDLVEDERVTKAPAPKEPAAQKRRNQPMPHDDEDDDDDLMEDERVTKASTPKNSAAQKRRNQPMPHDDEDDDDLMEDEPVTKAPTPKKSAAQKRRNQPMPNDNEDDDDLMEDEPVTKAPTPKKSAAQKRRNQPMPHDDEDDDDLMADKRVTKASASKKHASWLDDKDFDLDRDENEAEDDDLWDDGDDF